MFRVSVARRILHAHPRGVIASPLRPAIAHGVRFNSTQSPSSSSDLPPTADTPGKRQRSPEEALKKASLEKQDDLQRDWDAKILTYEEFLPRTQNPAPVRSEAFTICHTAYY